MRIGAFLTGLLAAAGLPNIGPAIAQDYPSRQVTIVFPFAPGGGADGVALLLAQKLSERLGRTFVVENRAGAGAVVGTAAVAKASPDGYTLLFGTSTPLAINATLFKKLPYDPAKDFAPIAHVANVPFVLVANPGLKVGSVAALIRLAKEKPGQISYASAGPGTPHHLFMELLKSEAGIDVAHVPYKGTLPGLTDVMAGHVGTMFTDLPPSLQLIKDGKLAALGISTKERSSVAGQIPSLAEAGLPAFNAAAWLMVVAPSGTPGPIVAKLHAEIKAIMALAEVKGKLEEQGMNPVASAAPDALHQFVQSEITRWGAIVARSGASVE